MTLLAVSKQDRISRLDTSQQNRHEDIILRNQTRMHVCMHTDIRIPLYSSVVFVGHRLKGRTSCGIMLELNMSAGVLNVPNASARLPVVVDWSSMWHIYISSCPGTSVNTVASVTRIGRTTTIILQHTLVLDEMCVQYARNSSHSGRVWKHTCCISTLTRMHNCR